MSEVISQPIIPGKRTLEYFQKGVLMSNKALDILHRDVAKYNINYILTFWLNQDILENFFGAMRSKGGFNDHPSPKDFKCRIRKYIMARNTEILNGKGSVENSEVRDLNMRRKEENI